MTGCLATNRNGNNGILSKKESGPHNKKINKWIELT